MEFPRGGSTIIPTTIIVVQTAVGASPHGLYVRSLPYFVRIACAPQMGGNNFCRVIHDGRGTRFGNPPLRQLGYQLLYQSVYLPACLPVSIPGLLSKKRERGSLYQWV